VPPLMAVGSAGEASLLAVDAPNIIIETVKPAEEAGADGTHDLVLRLYEAKRTATTCTLRTTLPVVEVHETDMLEGEIASEALSCEQGAIPLSFRPFECKTLRLRMNASA
jgi:alpha-mannosidase